jgi:hypothetical protein
VVVVVGVVMVVVLVSVVDSVAVAVVVVWLHKSPFVDLSLASESSNVCRLFVSPPKLPLNVVNSEALFGPSPTCGLPLKT